MSLNPRTNRVWDDLYGRMIAFLDRRRLERSVEETTAIQDMEEKHLDCEAERIRLFLEGQEMKSVIGLLGLTGRSIVCFDNPRGVNFGDCQLKKFSFSKEGLKKTVCRRGREYILSATYRELLDVAAYSHAEGGRICSPNCVVMFFRGEVNQMVKEVENLLEVEEREKFLDQIIDGDSVTVGSRPDMTVALPLFTLDRASA